MSFPSYIKLADEAWRVALCYTVIGFLFVLSLTSLSLPILSSVQIGFFLMALYYWSVFRPSLLPLYVVFFLGLGLDFASGEVIGINALLLIIIQKIIVDQRRFLMGQSFSAIWLGFAALVLVFSVLKFLMFSLVSFSLVYSQAIWINSALTIFLFPMIHAVLYQTHKIISEKKSQLSFDF